MSDHTGTSHNADSSMPQGSILRGILGGIAGMLVCILAMVLCWMCRMEELSVTFLMLAGLIIGWFYRLFGGRRSKPAAYAIVSIFTILGCTLWIMVLALLSGGISPARLIKVMTLGKLWSRTWEVMFSCAGIGLFVFLFFTRKWLLTYVDWERGPWHMACAYAGGALYNLLPQKLPAKNPSAYFEVRERFPPRTCIIVEGGTIRWKRLIRKDYVFSVHDIAGVVLGPSSGCNVLYDKNNQLLAKFASSMKNADLLFLWLLQWNIPIDNVPSGWLPADEDKPDSPLQ